MKRVLAFVVSIFSIGTGACLPDDQRTDRLDPEAGRNIRAEWPLGVVAQVDSGNAAFRVRDHEAALRHYREAVALMPDNSSAWYGIYMAERALGNEAAADSALTRTHDLSPGATLLHPNGGTEDLDAELDGDSDGP